MGIKACAFPSVQKTITIGNLFLNIHFPRNLRGTDYRRFLSAQKSRSKQSRPTFAKPWQQGGIRNLAERASFSSSLECETGYHRIVSQRGLKRDSRRLVAPTM